MDGHADAVLAVLVRLEGDVRGGECWHGRASTEEGRGTQSGLLGRGRDACATKSTSSSCCATSEWTKHLSLLYNRLGPGLFNPEMYIAFIVKSVDVSLWKI